MEDGGKGEQEEKSQQPNPPRVLNMQDKADNPPIILPYVFIATVRPPQTKRNAV